MAAQTTPPANGSTDTDTNASGFTAFQTNILVILADGSDYGLGIKRALEEYYGEDVNHGRLYPNLDRLVEDGLVAKSARDKRTNEYELTDAGRDAVASIALWPIYNIADTEERRDEIGEEIVAELYEDATEDADE